MQKIQGFVFDLDGTLVNTLEDIADACNDTISAAGYPKHSLDEYRYLVGSGQVNLLRRALPEGEFDKLDDDAQQALVARYTKQYDAGWHIKSKPYDGMPETLMQLNKMGMHLAVVTNKNNAWGEPFVKHFYPDVEFDKIVGEGPNVPIKPNPKGTLTAIESMGLTPDDCIFVGDTKVDIATGKNAKCQKVVGCLWGFRTREELEEAGADIIITRPYDLLDLQSSL